jgi:hypothetical protein
MAYRKNPTDKQQNVLEEARFEGGIPVHEDRKIRVVAKASQTGPYRTANAGTDLGKNAGVIMPHDDVPNRFVDTQQGKA